MIQPNLAVTVRAGEWWEYKLAPIFAAFYATALTLQVPVSALWLALLTAFLAIVPGAAYVSVLNDFTDRAEDLAAGKTNRLAGRSRAFAAMLIALTVAAGVVFCVLWRGDTLLLSVYLAAWLAFSLYSVPPFRWKTRGILGVLCDASGAHLFPILVAVILAFRGAGEPVRPLWLVTVGVWGFANGLRGILWHQLTDVEHDRASGARTFAARHPAALVIRFGTYLAFPLELLALVAMLVQMRSVVPVIFLLFYAHLVRKRLVHWKLNAVIVAPKPQFLILLHEYYELYLPVAILVASAIRHPLDWLVLAVHLLIFPTRAREVVHDVRKLVDDGHYKRR